MDCAQCREAISARLDGEDVPGEADAVEAHLAGCPACVAHQEQAARVTRLARTRAVESVPDLLDAVLAAGPPARRRSWRPAVLRLALGVVGLGQCALATAGIVTGGAGHGGMEMAGASAAHMAHESSAWNLALAIGFGWVAVGRSRPSGLIPLIAGFVGLLTVLSVVDVADGGVDASRLLTHLGAVIGLVLLVVLGRVTRHGDGGTRRATREPSAWPESRPSTAPWTDRTDADGHPGGLQPSARHGAAREDGVA